MEISPMKRRHCVACVVFLALINVILAADVRADDCCDWEDYEPEPSLAAYRAYLLTGELQPRQPITRYLIEQLNLSELNGAEGPVPAELAPDVIERILRLIEETKVPQRQVLVEAPIQEISRGDMRELGVDGFKNGAVITTDFANGTSNQQVITFSMFNQPNAPVPDMLRYSYRSGAWQTVSIGGLLHDADEDDVNENGLLEVPFLPHLFEVNKPKPGNLIVLVTPAIVDEHGMTRRPPAPPTGSPRTDIHTPGAEPPPGSPRTEVITPSGPGLIGSERRGGDWTVSINPQSGYVMMNPPRVGTGTHIVGSNERFLVETPDWIDGWTVGGTVSIPLRTLTGGSDEPAPANEIEDGRIFGNIRRPFLFIGGEYTDLSGDASARVEAGTDVTASTLINLQSPNGFTGIGFGTTGAEANIEQNYEAWQIITGGGFGMNVCGCKCTQLRFAPFVGIGESTMDVSSVLRNVTFPDNTVTLREDVDTFEVELALRTTVTHRLNRCLSVYGSAKIGGYYYDADGDATQSVNFPVLPPPDDFYDVMLRDSNDGFGFTGGIEGGLGWRVGHGISVHGAVGVDFLSDVPYWNNPANPAQPVAHVDTDDAVNVYGKFGIAFRF